MGHDWRVRPLRRDGRIFGWAVEHHNDKGWREWAALETHSSAMTLAKHLANNYLIVK